MRPVSRYLILCEREIHVTEWGKPGAPALVLWHGLARTGRDFDDLAAALADRYFILAPDMIGRGLSQWSPTPTKEYQLSFYVEVAQALVASYGFDKLRWLGTSMGGAIGIQAAAGGLQGRITHLAINDIGPQLSRTAIDRILSYAGAPLAFARMSEFETYIRTVYEPYGYASDAQWRRMAESSARRLPDGRITTHYDPDIVQQFVHHPQDYDQWPAYDRVTAKTLLLRGKESDLLQPEWAADMTRRGPKARLIVFAGCGHAPALNTPQQIGPVADFLAEGE